MTRYTGALFSAALLVISGISTTANAASCGYAESWDNPPSLAGWTANTTVTTVTQVAAGGNPNGYLETSGTASATFDLGALTQVATATGNFTGQIWTASVDINFADTATPGTFDAAYIRFRYLNSTQNGWLYPLTTDFSTGWRTHTVTFDPSWSDADARANGWITDDDISATADPSQPFATTMSNVYTTEVRLSSEGGFNSAGIDNFRLSCDGEDLLYGTDGQDRNLLLVSPVTGNGTLVGNTALSGSGGVASLAFDPTNAQLYAAEGGGSPNVYTVNSSTGLATLVGDSGLGVAAIPGLDFTPDGTLYASVNIAFGVGSGGDHLATIDPSTGLATVIGSYGACTGVVVPVPGIFTGSCDIDGMETIAFDENGILWGILREPNFGGAGTVGLYTIDTGTGAATFQSPILDVTGLPHPNGFVSMEIACDGTTYAGAARSSGGSSDGGQLVTIDRATGEYAFVNPGAGGLPPGSATSGTPLSGLALSAAACSSVEVSEGTVEQAEGEEQSNFVNFVSSAFTPISIRQTIVPGGAAPMNIRYCNFVDNIRENGTYNAIDLALNQVNCEGADEELQAALAATNKKIPKEHRCELDTEGVPRCAVIYVDSDVEITGVMSTRFDPRRIDSRLRVGICDTTWGNRTRGLAGSSDPNVLDPTGDYLNWYDTQCNAPGGSRRRFSFFIPNTYIDETVKRSNAWNQTFDQVIVIYNYLNRSEVKGCIGPNMWLNLFFRNLSAGLNLFRGKYQKSEDSWTAGADTANAMPQSFVNCANNVENDAVQAAVEALFLQGRFRAHEAQFPDELDILPARPYAPLPPNPEE